MKASNFALSFLLFYMSLFFIIDINTSLHYITLVNVGILTFLLLKIEQIEGGSL